MTDTTTRRIDSIVADLRRIKNDCTLPGPVRSTAAEAWDLIIRLDEELQAHRHSEAVDRITIHDLERRLQQERQAKGEQEPSP